jgi:hypothetical protein
MRSLGIGLAIALILAGTAPTAAFAAGPDVSKEARAKGMAAAPGLVSAGGLDCNVSDARFIGQGAPDPKTKQKTSLYELACTGNEGVLVQQIGDAAPTTFTCEQASEPRPDGKPNTTGCILPGNSDPKAGLIPYIAKTGVTCTPDRVRALGQSPTEALFELVCKEDNGGLILQISSPPRLDKPAVASPCIGLPEGGNVSCTMTPRAKQMAVVDKLLAASGKPCTVKEDGRRYIGATTSGQVLYEVACQDGKGYVLEAATTGTFSRAVDCAQADSIAGGCKLTDARQAKTEQAGLYSTLAKKAGFNCDVSGYAVLPSQASAPTTEVVELKCANRPDGAIAMFAPSGPTTVYDCAHSEIVGYRCGLTKPDAAYATLTKDLKALGKASCTVSESRMVGITADKHAYVEVGCSDGLQGYMIEYTPSPVTAKTAIVCNDAKGIAGGCTLPGNTKKS